MFLTILARTHTHKENFNHIIAHTYIYIEFIFTILAVTCKLTNPKKLLMLK